MDSSGEVLEGKEIDILSIGDITPAERAELAQFDEIGLCG